MKKTVERPTSRQRQRAPSASRSRHPSRRLSSPRMRGRAAVRGGFRAAILLPRFSAAPRTSMRIGHITLANRLFAAPMAGVTDRPFRQLCKRLGAGYAVSEMVTSRKDLWASAEDEPARRPRRRGRADRGADRRHRRGDDGRGRRLQRRARRADHRHQHGLPGEEGLQPVGRLGADEGRAARARDRRGGRRRLRAARRSGDAEDAHRLVREREERRARSRAPPRAPASRWSRCTGARASRATRATPSTTPSPR